MSARDEPIYTDGPQADVRWWLILMAALFVVAVIL